MKLFATILVALLLLGGALHGIGSRSGSSVERICKKDTPERIIPWVPGEERTYNRITTNDGTKYAVEDSRLFESLKEYAVYRLSYSGKYDISHTDLEDADPVEDASIPPCAA